MGGARPWAGSRRGIVVEMVEVQKTDGKTFTAVFEKADEPGFLICGVQP